MINKISLLLLLATISASAAPVLQDVNIASPASIVSAGGSNSQAVHTSKLYDDIDSVLLDTQIAVWNAKQGAITTSSAPANQFCTGFTGSALTYAAIASGAISNAMLANSSTTVNGQVCSLGSTCTISVGSGTVTSASVVTANGFQGTVATATTTPAITLQTSVASGSLLKASSGSLVAATSNSDYLPATSGSAIQKANGSGGLATAVAGTDYAAATTGTSAQLLANNGSGGFSNVTVGSGLTLSGGTLTSSGGGGSGTSISKSISQTAHGFSVGNWVYYNGTSYALAQASTVTLAEVIGVVTQVIDTNNFVLTVNGSATGLSGLTAGTIYFLSPTSAGAITATEPSTAGQVDKTVCVADSTTSCWVVQDRGTLIASALPINAVAAVGSTPNANAASISGSTLNLQPANAFFGGVVSTVAQAWAGIKEFVNGIILDEISTPSTPAATKHNLYFKADGNMYMKNSAGIEVQLTGVSVTNTTDWKSDLTFTFGAGFGTTTSSKVFYRYVGDSIEVSGSFVAGTTSGAIASVILPAGVSLDLSKLQTNATSTLGYYYAAGGSAISAAYPMYSDGSTTGSVFITTSASSGVYAATAGSTLQGSGTTGSFHFIAPILGRTGTGGLGTGMAASDPVSYTPTLTNLGTGATSSLYWSRDGKYMEIYGIITTGTSMPSSAFSISLPSGYTMDTSVTSASGYLTGGNCTAQSASTNGTPFIIPIAMFSGTSTSNLYGTNVGDGSSPNNLTPVIANKPFSSSTTYACSGIRVPIAGWSSTPFGSPLTTSGTVERIDRAIIANNGTTCSISSQSGSWLTSVTRAGTANCTGVITSGEFSSAPTCNVTPISPCVSGFHNAAPTTTALSFGTYNSGGAGADCNFQVICQGPH